MAAWCVSKPPRLQSCDDKLHDAAYQLILAKYLQVRWARGHRDPKKAHSLQVHQNRINNEWADCPVRTDGMMYPCHDLGSSATVKCTQLQDCVQHSSVCLAAAHRRRSVVNADAWHAKLARLGRLVAGL